MLRADDVTLVICTRERPGMLRDALASFRASSPAEMQILVVDSASTTPETLAVARAAGVEAVRTDVKGLSIARNTGLAATARQIVFYTDDDCTGVDGWVQAALAHFDDPTVGAVTGTMLDHSMIGSGGDPGPVRRYRRTIEGLDAGHGAVMAFRRELLLELGGFDPVLGAGRRLAGAEDLDIFCRILDAGHAIVFDPGCVVHHRHTREDDAYATLHRGYGLGLGALTAKWLRLRFGVGLLMAAIVFKRTVSRAFRNRRIPRRRGADLALLGGFFGGMFQAMRFRRDGRVFVDDDPPHPIVLNVPSRSGDES
ncbi:glycosyltransferase family A protein [Microbacterium sp. BWT-B31]|uniref:glycosyltransferase family 2 protein n=1 Tax=Microbacterium sp. BWT-B31 TaxID=3232072 RepID=UPI003529A23C